MPLPRTFSYTGAQGEDYGQVQGGERGNTDQEHQAAEDIANRDTSCPTEPVWMLNKQVGQDQGGCGG